MPTTLLSLSDEVLQRIAHFTNRDAYIPFPSLQPYWSNFAGGIASANHTDFLSFRSTCKRIRSVCGLKGLHLNLRDFDAICHWSNDAPVAVLKGIRRLRLSPPIRGCYSSRQHVAWNAITSLLTHLASLEELVIEEFPNCGEPDEPMQTLFRLPSAPICTNLKSLAIGVSCAHCSSRLIQSLLPAASKVQHLRMAINAPLTPSVILEELSDAWQECVLGSDIPLQTLILGVRHSYDYIAVGAATGEEEEEAADVMRDVGQLFPHLRTLIISAFEGNDYFLSDLVIEVQDDMKFTSRSNDDDAKGFSEYLSSLPSFAHLEYLDCGISLLPGMALPSPPVVQHYRSKKEFLDKVRTFHTQSEEYEVHLDQYRRHLTELVSILMARFPSLLGGAFWERGTRQYRPFDWYRWTWSTQISQDDGKRHAVIDARPLHLSRPIMRSREGSSASIASVHSCPDSHTDVGLEGKGIYDVDISRWENDDTW